MEFFKKIGLAFAFSPRLEALLHETSRLKSLFDADLVLIHVGDESEELRASLRLLMDKAGLTDSRIIVRWEKGNPGNRILAVCREEQIDLLIAGALKRENLVQSYLGSTARKILRKADCSVLTLLNPKTTPVPFKSIVVNAEDSPYVESALKIACRLGMLEEAKWLHVVREIKLYGLTMAAAPQATEAEYEDFRQEIVRDEIASVEKKIDAIPHEGLRINYKILSGKSGFELRKFTISKKADLLIVGAPSRKFSFFDRLFRHDLEYVFADLPANLLVVNPGRVNG